MIFETASARGACAAEWWAGITKLAKSKESEFGLGYIWELDGIQWAGTHVVRSDVCATLGNSALVDAAMEVE